MIWICPNCQRALTYQDRVFRCADGHSFDISAEGYVNLLPANQKHSKLPGDSPEMVRARSVFLSKGYYSPLREALCKALKEGADKMSRPVILDCGCGEGYYTEGFSDALENADIYGVDIAKAAVKKAAKRTKTAGFAVASVYRLPVGDQSVDFLTNVFSPISEKEFLRVLKPGGKMLYVVPGKDHLWQMKQILYENPYKNVEEQIEYPGFVYEKITKISGEIRVENEDISALFSMTPYLWRTPKEGIERLKETSVLQTQIDFDIHIFRKEENANTD